MENPKILVPFDFAACTEAVVARAAGLARELKAELVLLHSVEVPAGIEDDLEIDLTGGKTRTALALLKEEARERLSEFAEQLQAQGLDVELVVTAGRPADEILRLAREEQVARIVMGTHARRGLSRLLLGSVAEKVTRGAPCPVDVVRSEWQPSCPAGSCAWCASGRTEAALQLEAERDG